MKILLYETSGLDEKISKKLKVWKAWHITLYALIAVLGILNFTFLQNTKALVDDQCVFYPVALEFHMVEVPKPTHGTKIVLNAPNKTNEPSIQAAMDKEANKLTIVDKDVSKREISYEDAEYDTAKVNSSEIMTDNVTHQLMLQTDRTLFGDGTECQFAEYMPVLSTIFAVVWITMFTMCPGGGRSRSGLQEPWRILPPALIFALLMVAFTGFSFTTTNSGLHAFCASFQNVTNATTCSAVNPFLERSAGVSWGFGGRAAATRAASACVWAGWACAGALLLARCLAAPDFTLRRTGVYLTSDPQQKIVSSLKKKPSSSSSSSRSPQRGRDVSLRSEPTQTSQLVTAPVDPGAGDSGASSLITPPVNDLSYTEAIELAQAPGNY